MSRVNPLHPARCGCAMCFYLESIEDIAAPSVTVPQVERALREHWLTALECDHEAKTDTVRCYCTVWTGTPQPSVRAAVEEWVQHVVASLVPNAAARAATPGAET